MINTQRVIYSNNGVMGDLSLVLNDYRARSVVIEPVATEDYIYIASDLPFNHRYIDVKVPNDVSAVVKVQIWFGGEWVDAVDVIDQTDVSGAPLAQSGIISWKTPRLKGWDRELDSEDVTGVSVVGIYDYYWIRLSWSATLLDETELNYIGHKFSSDDVLASYYPDLMNNSVRGLFDSLATTWDEQHFMAAEAIIRDLKAAGSIKSGSQILDYEMFELAAVHKVAEIVYKGLGKAYDEERKSSRDQYVKAMGNKFMNLDYDADGNLSDVEKSTQSVGFMKR